MADTIIAMAAWLGVAAAGTSSTFSVTIPLDKGYADVEAHYTLGQPYLELAEGSYSEGVSGGLAGFIEDVRVTGPEGTPIAVDGPQSGRWRLDASAGVTVTVQYRVRLDHAKHKWPFGADEIAYANDDAVFFVSRTMLLLAPGVGAARVRFSVPEGWDVATPWSPVSGEAFTYEVADGRELTRSCILIGSFIEREIRAGETVVELAMGRGLEPYAESFDTAVRACAAAYHDLFRDAPPSRFLAVVDVNPVGGITDGSAYPNSISMLTPKRVEGVNFEQAIYTMAHEILHLWNGNRMRAAGQIEWFREGFTDYLTWRVLAQERLVDDDALLRELRRQFNAYLNDDRTISIAAAGERKSQNRVLVYEGGSLVAFCLDGLIRQETNGERTLADFMRELYARSALKDAHYNEAMIVAVAGETARRDLSSFFERHVNGLEPLPLDDALAAFGLRAERKDSGTRTSVTIAPDDSADGAAATARNAFLGLD